MEMYQRSGGWQLPFNHVDRTEVRRRFKEYSRLRRWLIAAGVIEPRKRG